MIQHLANNNAIVGDENSAFTFEVINPRENITSQNPWSPIDAFSSKGFVSRYADWNVFPFGSSNNLPVQIRNIVYSNSIVPGMMNRKLGLNWGKGPKLYAEEFDEKGNLVRKYQRNAEVEKWLKSWNWEKYLLKASTDFSFIESHYTKFIMKKGWRIGEPFVYKLEHIAPNKPMVVGKKETPTHIILQNEDDVTRPFIYPLINQEEGINAGISVMYSNLPSFCSDFFAIPHIMGTVPWIVQNTNVPIFFEALKKNAINIKYHITSPQAYWDAKRDELKKIAETSGVPYNEKQLKTFRTKILREIKEVLSGLENAGKFWHSETILQQNGMNLVEAGWKITPIEQNMKEVVESQISIASKSERSISAALGVHAALGGITSEGSPNSGSEQYYALNNYLQTGIDIPEMVIMEAINYAIAINFPEIDLKMGLYHDDAKMQQDMSKEQRNLTTPKI